MAPPPKKPTLPLVIASVSGALALVFFVLLIARGSAPTPVADEAPKPRPAEPPRPPSPEVVKLELEGKMMCEEGTKLVEPRLTYDPSAPRENVRKDLERGLKLLKQGLDAYNRAKRHTGKDYPIGDPSRLRDAGLRVLCADLEQEGRTSCDAGLNIIRSCEDRMTRGDLTDEEKIQLRSELEQGIRLITEGMNFFDRSNQVSGHMFDTSRYGQARKAATYKLGELK